MGRYYRTSSARPLDYMYQDNIPLMERVIGANDQFITENLQGLGQLGQLANYNHLLGDSEDAQKIISGYRNEIDSVSKAIQEDPANWRKQTEPIRNLSRKLQTDYESGPISKQMYNYTQRKTAFDNVDKQVASGKLGADEALAYKNHWDEEFQKQGGKTAYDPSTGTFKTYKGGTAMDSMDIKKILSDGLDKIKADKDSQYHEDEYGNAWYFNKETKEVEQITPEKVLKIATDNITPQMMRYLKERSDVGLMSGVTDKEGKFIQPYSYSEVGLSPQEAQQIADYEKAIEDIKDPATKKRVQDTFKQQVDQLRQRQTLNWREESPLTAPLRGLMETYSHRSVKEGNDLSNNSKGKAYYDQGNQNQRQANDLAMRYKIHTEKEKNANTRAKEKLDLEWEKYRNPITKDGKTTSKDTKKTEPLPLETSVSRLYNNSLEDWNTKKDGKDIPILSNAGLATEIDTKKKELLAVDVALKGLSTLKAPDEDDYEGWKTYNQNKLQKQQLEATKMKLQSELTDRRNWYNSTTDAVLNNDAKSGVKVLPEDVAIYKKYEKDRDGLAQVRHIDELKKKYPDVIDEGKSTASGLAVYKESPQVEAARDELVKYKKTKALIDKGRENILSDVRKDVIDNDAIQLGTKDSESVSSMILSNPRGLKLFDSEGRSTAGVELDGKGISWNDEYNMTFGGDSFKEYMDRYNVKMHVRKVANTTKLGTGNAVAEVVFEDPGGNIKANKPYYIELTPEMQKSVATKFKDNKNADIANLARAIDDDEANSIRNQFNARPTSNINGHPFTLIVTSKTGKRVPLQVTKMGGGKLEVFMEGDDGKPRPFARRKEDGTYESFTPGGIPGMFNGLEDLIAQYKLGKYGQ